MFLELEKLAGDVRRWVEFHPEWPRITKSIAYKWLDEGLQDRCITRDLPWGVPVPREGFEDKVFYVWFDAPIGYIGATKEWSDGDPERRDWKSWWYDAPDVEYVQFLAKDNVPFHTIFFPATILGTREPWTLASYIMGFNWLTYGGGKFSTSQNRGIFMDQALEHFPADYWRYFLISQAPESGDEDFRWEHFASVVNKDLANNFGNFVNRTLKLTVRHFGREVPAGGEPGAIETQLRGDCKQVLEAYRDHLDHLEFRKAIQELRKLWSLGNVYLDEREPWSLVKENPAAAAVVLRTAIDLIRIFSIAARPVIPFTAEKVLRALHLSAEEMNARLDQLGDQISAPLTPGRTFEVPPPLFQRIDEDRVRALREKFAGDE